MTISEYKDARAKIIALSDKRDKAFIKFLETRTPESLAEWESSWRNELHFEIITLAEKIKGEIHSLTEAC